MADGAAKATPVAAFDAVEQIEAASIRRDQAGRKSSPYREPSKDDREQQLDQHGDPKGRKGIRPQPVEPSCEIQLSLRTGDAGEADAETDHRSHDQGDHAQLQAGGKGAADDREHRFLV